MTRVDALDDPVGWARSQAEADPVQRRVLEALARRAAAQPAGALRERLVAAMVRRAQVGPVARPVPPERRPAQPGPLGALLAELQAGAGDELRNVQAHRRTWHALRVSRRMADVNAPPPGHLGPLNSRVLATRALQQLKDLAPDYLQRLLTQLDTLAALAALPAEPASDRPARTPAPRRRR